MKEHPIIVQSWGIIEILADRKTQTQRVILPQPIPEPGMEGAWRIEMNPRSGYSTEKAMRNYLPDRCPYGGVGDRLWVRERWAWYPALNRIKPSVLNPALRSAAKAVYYTDPAVNHSHYMWRSPIHMPRWCIRITLVILEVGIRRVQEMTESAEGERDAIAEGFPVGAEVLHASAVDWYQGEWDSLNAERGYPWESNPWVWRIKFKRLEDEATTRNP